MTQAEPRRPAGLAERFQQPPGFAWGSFTAADGARLRWGHLAPAQPRVDCILVGGFTEFAEKYFETIRDLAARGLAVWFLDWRGQGGSERPATLPTLPRARDFARDAADLAAFAASLPRSGRQRLLVAHSMGGAIALLCLHRHPGVFDAAVLSAPMLGLATPGYPRPVARTLAVLATTFGFADRLVPGRKPWAPKTDLSPERSRTSSDPARCTLENVWFSAYPALRVDPPTYGWLRSAFALVTALRAPSLLRSIAAPILLGSAGIESFVDPAAHRHAAALLPDCTLVAFPAAKHELFLERDEVRGAWLAAIDRFVADRFKA
ncbi:MAG: alpha/beta hydrolase [Alphaproteobacteria bacterium]|nr:alpha/beta hydrolase [Alphaproteobacteria bacterium]